MSSVIRPSGSVSDADAAVITIRFGIVSVPIRPGLLSRSYLAILVILSASFPPLYRSDGRIASVMSFLHGSGTFFLSDLDAGNHFWYI